MSVPRRHESSRQVPVGLAARLRARINTSSLLIRPVALLIVLALLFWLVYLGYAEWTQDGTFWRELVVALIGTLLTIAGSFLVAVVAFREQLKAGREARILRRFDEESVRRSSLRVGAMVIPDVMAVVSCRQGQEWTDHAQMEWQPFGVQDRVKDEIFEAAYAERIPRQEENARRNSISFTDDECVDLRSARVSLVRRDGRRIPSFSLEPAVSTYFDFAATGADLDSPLETGPCAGKSLREAWGVGVQTLEDVAGLRFPAKIGVGTAVVTSDNRLVLGVRGRTFIAGQGPGRHDRSLVHIVAEGMMPFDVTPDRIIDPRLTSLRGIREELLIGSDSDSLARLKEHVATGFFMDQLRMQPCFSYLARIDLSWDELNSGASAAQDFWEVAELRSLPFDIAHVGLRALLLGQHPDMEIASNHGAAVLWFACLYRFGFHRMRDALSLPVAI